MSESPAQPDSALAEPCQPGLSQSDSPKNIQTLKGRTLSGLGTLFRRQILVKGIFFLGNIVLARLLVPQAFGTYAIVAFIVQFFGTFGDIGLGASLIQKQGELKEAELCSIFWVQIVTVFCIALGLIFASPLALRLFPSLPAHGVHLIRFMALSFFLTALKSIPTILLERELDFDRIAKVEILEAVSFQGGAIWFASLAWNEWSFIFAALLRAMVGVAAIYLVSPWRPRFRFDMAAMIELIRFGLPYQLNVTLGFVKDAVTPVFVGSWIGTAAVGYLNWGRLLAFSPLMISESFGRVAFPVFSRIQQDRSLLGAAVEKSIRSMTTLMFPLTAVMMALVLPIIRIIFTEAWLPGLPAFLFYCTSPLIIGLVLPMYSAIVSLGRSEIILKMTVLLIFLEWGLGVPFTIVFGFTGISMNQPIISSIFFFIYRRILRNMGVVIRVRPNIGPQFLAAGSAALLTWWLGAGLCRGVPSLAAVYLGGLGLSFLFLHLIAPDLTRAFYHDFKAIMARSKANT